MLKKNTRKRLLAGALATVMMLTMCPSWALADDEGIATLPANEEIAVPVDDSTPAADTTKTPADPTPSVPEEKPAEGQDPAPAPSNGGASGGTDSTESGNSTNPTVSKDSENISQNNNAANSTPDVNNQPQDAADINDVSMASLDVDARSWNTVKTIDAEYWITNARATDTDNVNTLTIRSDMAGITDEGGIPVNQLAKTRNNINGYKTTVFWQARVLSGRNKQTTDLDNDQTAAGTEIDAIRYYGDGYRKSFQYCDKETHHWTNFVISDWPFGDNDQLVFYYLIRTGYTHMVQVDVSDWTVDTEPSYDDRRSVTYQVYVKNADGSYTRTDDRKFWYNKAFTVSSVRVRQTESKNYSIDRVELDPSALGRYPTPNENGEYQFSLNLRQTERNATVKIYVKPNVNPVRLDYKPNGGKITSAKGTYTDAGWVWPDETITTPTVEQAGFDFGGWYTDEALTHEWTGTKMPNKNLTLHAKWDRNQYPYTIEHYKYNPDTNKYVLQETEGDSVVAGTEITATPKNYDGYVLNPHAAGYLASGTVDGTVPKLTLKLFYDPDTNGNGIPDSREYRLTFKVVNGNWNNATNAEVIVYVPFKNADGTAIGNVVIPDAIPAVGEKPAAGYQAGYWKDPAPTVGKEITGDVEFTYTYVPVSKYPYAIEHYKYNPATKAYEIVEVDTEKNSAVAGTVITATPKNYDGYVLNPHAEGYLASGTVVKTEDSTVPALTLKLFYDPDANGNEIPDSWEYRLIFKVVNGAWNDDWYGGGNADFVTYVPFKNNKTGEAYEEKDVVIPATRIPFVGEKPNSGYHAGSWNTTFDGKTPVKQDTVFTYTYAKNSSGGSSGGGHHRKPTVTIPDKVPTGLNGNDHYAYIVGYPDKTVRPQNGITRAEVATIFFRLLTDETRNANSTKSNSYSDVAAGAWYNHAVSTLSAMGIVKGDSNGKFNPNAPITRAEFAAIAARFDDKANSTTADFSDIVSHWAKNEISAASNNGWINGYPDGTFRPDNKITRAEAMTLVNRVLKRLPETAEDLHDDMIKWSDNSDASQWFYLAVQEATNSHYYKAKENKSEKWTELRDTRDWTELEK